MTLSQTLALFQCLRRALLMIVRHLDGLIEELKRDPPEAITISRDEAYRDFAAVLGRSVETLTEEEKGAALMNHVMEKLS